MAHARRQDSYVSPASSTHLDKHKLTNMAAVVNAQEFQAQVKRERKTRRLSARFVANARIDVVRMSADHMEPIADDPYLEHLQKLLKQSTYRINVYRLSADLCEDKDETLFDAPIQALTTLSTIASVVVFLSTDPAKRNLFAMLAGALALVSTSWTSIKNVEKLGIKATNFRSAVKRYTDLSKNVGKAITKV
jgi:hypothetical protein